MNKSVCRVAILTCSQNCCDLNNYWLDKNIHIQLNELFDDNKQTKNRYISIKESGLLI